MTKIKQKHPKTKRLITRHLKIIKTCSEQYAHSPLLVAIAHRNQPKFLKRALASVYAQSLFQDQLIQILVLDDQSDRQFEEEIKSTCNHTSVTLIHAECGTPARSRNMLLDHADQNPAVQWVARLDADDELATPTSLEALWLKAQSFNGNVVLGSNYLRSGEFLLNQTNHPDPLWLKDGANLVDFVEAFCTGAIDQELPSCNLLLKNNAGHRYPRVTSAEDHWLVATMLLLQPDQITLVTESIYCIYTLNGQSTQTNQVSAKWYHSRTKLQHTLRRLWHLMAEGKSILGYGFEGIVIQADGVTTKEFFPWAMTDKQAARLKRITDNKALPIPHGKWLKTSGTWYYQYRNITYRPIQGKISIKVITEFLCSVYLQGVVPLNIKRANLMLCPSGKLHYIDIGKDLQPLATTYFLDVAARLFAIGVLDFSDDELQRRPSTQPQSSLLEELNGFSDYYRKLMTNLHPIAEVKHVQSPPAQLAPKVTLLIKACGQDSNGFYEQLSHIVTQLECPVRFARKLLLIDQYNGPFLRQYAEGNLNATITQAQALKNAGLIDEILIAPDDSQERRSIYKKWFNITAEITPHTVHEAPLYNQLWAFDQIETRYVLQCDCDVLIGRKDLMHNYLSDMLAAINAEEVQCVGFNIPKSTDAFLPYHGEPGQFAPEVRFGLLDLRTIATQLPISNPVINGRPSLTWHRAIQANDRANGRTRSVRGGDPASFYVHPLNHDKGALGNGMIRDLISQGVIPTAQREAFDLQINAQWQYPVRNESIVVLLKGRFTQHTKLKRCLNSLRMQDDQNFGLILIDDHSGAQHHWNYPLYLAELRVKTTLIRHGQHQGRLPNFRLAINQIMTNENAMVVILDQDDALLQPTIIRQIREGMSNGHDLIQMPMFRPNKPLKNYKPDYQQSRKKQGGNVWAHLRAFKRQLFQAISEQYLQNSDGEWFESLSDYATMLPMVELAQSPLFIDTGYAYWHERYDYSEPYKQKQQKYLQQILTKGYLSRGKA